MAPSNKPSALSTEAYQLQSYQVCPDSRQLERDFLCIVASVESKSLHPIASEIVQVARLNNILPVSVTGFQNFPGRGIGGAVTLPDEHRPRAVLVGSRELITASGLEIPELLRTTLQTWESEPNTRVVLGGWDGLVRGIMKFLLLHVPH
jgi:cation transport ATPase